MKMKNKMKKLVSAILVAMVMMVSMNVPTQAAAGDFDGKAKTGTITIKRDNATYTAYRVFDYKAGTGAYDYTVTDEFANFFGSDKGSYGNYSIADLKDNKTFNTAAKIQAFAENLTKFAIDKGVEGTAFAGGSAKELPIGYYVIAQTGSTTGNAYVQNKPITVALPTQTKDGEVDKFDYAVEIEPKDTLPTVDKDIVKDGKDVDASNENIGDDVTYKLTADVVKYQPNVTESKVKYYLTDTLSAGLTYNNDAKVYGLIGDVETKLTEDTDYTVTGPTEVTGGHTIKFDFTYSNIKAFDSVRVDYTAKLNENAIIGGTGNPNDVTLTYTNSPKVDDIYTTPEKEVITYTYGIAIFKTAEDETTPLQYATFGIYSDKDCTTPIKDKSGEAIVATSGADGYAYFKGLEAGTYYIKETVAPSGYVLSTNPTKVVIDATDMKNPKYYIDDSETAVTVEKLVSGNEFVEINITNSAGFSLPSTGGMGTWVFTIGGLVIMAGAVLILVGSKKKAK